MFEKITNQTPATLLRDNLNSNLQKKFHAPLLKLNSSRRQSIIGCSLIMLTSFQI